MQVSPQDELLVRNLVAKWEQEDRIVEESETYLLELEPGTRRENERLQKLLRARTEEARDLVQRLLMNMGEKLPVRDITGHGNQYYDVEVLLPERFRGRVAKVIRLAHAGSLVMKDGTSVEINSQDIVIDVSSPLRVVKSFYQSPRTLFEFLGLEEAKTTQ